MKIAVAHEADTGIYTVGFSASDMSFHFPIELSTSVAGDANTTTAQAVNLQPFD